MSAIFRRVRILSSIAIVSGLIGFPAGPANAGEQTCDATCQAQVTWYWHVQQTLARMWYGAVIASQPAAQCVAHHESHGDYHAENAVSTASGKYQFVDRTWQNVSAARGRPDLPLHAASAPTYEQEASFWWAWEHVGSSPWRGSGCEHLR